jgi:hypothetical protein
MMRVTSLFCRNNGVIVLNEQFGPLNFILGVDLIHVKDKLIIQQLQYVKQMDGKLIIKGVARMLLLLAYGSTLELVRDKTEVDAKIINSFHMMNESLFHVSTLTCPNIGYLLDNITSQLYL